MKRRFFWMATKDAGDRRGSLCDWLSWPLTCSGNRASCPKALWLFRSLCNSVLLIYNYAFSLLLGESFRECQATVKCSTVHGVSPGFLDNFADQHCKKIKANSWNDMTTNQADSCRGHKLLTGGFIIHSLKQGLIKTAYDWVTDCFIDLAEEWER